MGKDAKPENASEMTEVQQISIRSQKLLRKLSRSFSSTWKMYRASKTGLAGMAIVLGFFIMATFAPWIAPFDVEFKAPSEDIFIADNTSLPMVLDENWSAPIGLTEATREATLTRILVYSDQGTARIFPVTYSNGIRVGLPVNTFIEVGGTPSYLDYAHFYRSFFFILHEDVLHEFDYNLVPTGVEYELPFTPKYHSNLWNAYSEVLNQGRLAFVLADENNIWLIDKRPPNPIEPWVEVYTDSITITDANITGSPIVIDGFFENGSMIVAPTDRGLVAYALNISAGAVTGYVNDVRIGDRMWLANYSVDGEPFEPVMSERPISYQYPRTATGEFGMFNVMMATKDGRVVAYDRENGSIAWANPLIMPAIRDYEITGLYESPSYVLVAGTSQDRGFVAGLDPALGVVMYNYSLYSSFNGHINSDLQFVFGQRNYLFSTDNAIYVMNELLRINATFSPPGGTARTPVSFVGNVFVASAIGGNYFAIITADNRISVESLQGINVAPLPPGTYASGNRYILGTDYEGHDILTLLIYGTRAELMVGVTAAFFAVVIGTIVGLVSGYYSGLVDDILMRTTDVVLSLPGLVIILLFAAVFGPSLLNIIIIIAILSWAGIARVIRSVTMTLKQRSFVDAAIIAGASDSRLIFRHIAPNVIPYTFLYMTFTISGAIVTEAILAFLGFGDVNYVTWGMMLQYLQISGHTLTAPWWLLPPGLAITLLCMAFYLIGRAFDEVVNPRLRKR